MASSTMVCVMVEIPLTVTTMPAPTIAIIASESAKEVE